LPIFAPSPFFLLAIARRLVNEFWPDLEHVAELLLERVQLSGMTVAGEDSEQQDRAARMLVGIAAPAD